MKGNAIRSLMSQRGDTLVEVSIAIAIISSVIAGTYATANLIGAAGRSASDRGEAVALEQQAAEMLRNMRDNEFANGTAGWDTFENDALGAATPSCALKQSAPVKLTPPIATPNPATMPSDQWTWDNVNGDYQIASTSNTYTIKTVGCYPDAAPHASIVFTISASWDSGHGTNTAELSSTLSNVSDINQQPLGF